MIICTEHVSTAALHSRLVELNEGEENVNVLAVLPYRYYHLPDHTSTLAETLVIYRKDE